MRWTIVALTLALMIAGSPRPAAAAAYSVTVAMADWDVYWDSINAIAIVTLGCNHITYFDQATLLYEAGSIGNKLVFSSGLVCTVEGVYEPNARLRRVDNNLYQDLQTQRVVQTRGCLSLALSEPALIFRDRVVFLEAGQGC